MSVSKWAYTPEKCDGDYCPEDCDVCPKNDDRRGYECDPEKNTECDKKRCFWRRGGECRITLHWEYATDDEQQKHPRRNDED